MSKAKHNVISYSKVEIDRIQWKDLQSTERVPSQDIGYINYDHPKNGERQFDIQTPEIKMDAGGIPDGDGPYYKTTAQRAFVKIPLEVNPNVKGETDEERQIRADKLEKFKNTLMAIDKWMEDNKEKIFGSAKQAKKYKYQPIVRVPQAKDSDSDSEDENPSEDGDDVVVSHRPMYMKAKIPIVWETDNVDLDVYRVNEEGSEEFESDGKWSQITDIVTLDDLKKHVAYMRNVKFVLHACKYWAQKQGSNGSSTRLYGVTFKVRRVEVKPGRRTQEENRSEDDGELFADSDDEDEVVTKFVEQAKKLDLDDDEDKDEDEEDNDSDSDSESEDEPVVEKKKPVRRSRKKTSSKNA